MKPISYKYTCGKCNNTFFAPGMPQGAYGEFVLRSGTADICACMSVFEDKTLDELDMLIRKNANLLNVKPNEIVDIQFNLYSITTDPSEDGSQYELGIAPMCPHCKARKPAAWIEECPIRSIDLKPVTHRIWTAMSEAEKLEAIRLKLL